MARNNQIQTGTTPLPVIEGGTGLATTTANRILYSSANDVVDEIATANNSVMTTDGSGVPSFNSTLPSQVVTSIPGRLSNIQVFTSGTAATYTTPAGVTAILVFCQGGGGGGGGVDAVSAQISCAGGGSGGGYCWKYFSSVAASYTYTVGGGGAGGAAGNNNGTDGTSTTFDTMTAGGGGGGGGATGSATAAMQGAGGIANATSGGTVNVTGDIGGQGGGTLTYINSGYGGESSLGFGAPGRTLVSSTSVAGVSGQNYGGGGSGALALNDTTDRAGGNGAQGIIIVYEYS